MPHMPSRRWMPVKSVLGLVVRAAETYRRVSRDAMAMKPRVPVHGLAVSRRGA